MGMKPSLIPSATPGSRIGLPGYDCASQGAYFVTICVHGWECLLGKVVDGGMRPSRQVSVGRCQMSVCPKCAGAG